MTASPQPAEELLRDPGEILFRQIRPEWLEDGQPGRLSFLPLAKDEGELSVTRGALTTAEAAYNDYIATGRFKSAGTWGISVEQVTDPQARGHAGRDIGAYGRPMESNPAYGFVDCRELGSTAKKRIAATYLIHALNRGCQYEPPV